MILDFIFSAIEAVVDFVIDVIVGIFDFFNECVNYVKKFIVNKQRSVPFIANANKPEFKALLSNAPKKNVGIFEGVYDTEKDEITGARYVAADELDAQTKQVLGREPLVTLG